MASRGWLAARKQGRRSQYSLTGQGRALLEPGERRIFEPPFADWDGLWHLVVYSLPESKRDLRHALRGQLLWLGFGRLAPATWISPRDRQAELEYICGELGGCEYVELFAGLRQPMLADGALVARCWDLPRLASEYREFVACYAPEYEQEQTRHAAQLRDTAGACFARRFWLTLAFLPFPRKDPGLPVALLPPDWAGFEARRLFEQYRSLLAPYADQFVDDVMDVEAPILPA